MTTLTLEFQLEESLAYAYRAAQPQEKEDIKRLFERLLSAKFKRECCHFLLFFHKNTPFQEKYKVFLKNTEGVSN